MYFTRVMLVFLSLPLLSGCLVTKTVGVAVDVTGAAAGAVIGATGEVVEGTVDVLTPDGDKDDDDESENDQ